ncbi:nuclear transport factor 2 family protein [Flavobacterium salilacus subsp. salilacus]|uniref:nuclear transport factor 2 family protein n=1 Tax=Flavobacterium TaxID=237 RepID=UPI001074EA58|nr:MULTISPECIES: nuclear transport factor 2 family protein [Flavobacterium]KAF2515443.1 nuclear transport factor 2 family protein [Flavobacterium salilacus subsp. salilacus]MBE1615838.1 nuclear transport factor 2 family protein [Flavobacterium sp. SaA2.13]
MKKLFLFLSLAIVACNAFINTKPAVTAENEKEIINALLNDWHVAAANADYTGYFSKIADDGYFIGTDAKENWDKKAFAIFAKPHFDKGKAWDFKTLERNIYFSKDGKTAWFDELLDTWMKVCRGSGVLEKEGNEWKIKHYVLSMTVPNEVTKEILPLKAKYEDTVIAKLKK